MMKPLNKICLAICCVLGTTVASAKETVLFEFNIPELNGDFTRTYVVPDATNKVPGYVKTERDGLLISSTYDTCENQVDTANNQIEVKCKVQNVSGLTISPTNGKLPGNITVSTGTQYTLYTNNLPPRDTVTKVYTVHTTTEPGYITTTQGETVLSVVSDTCTPTVGKNASNKDALVLSCKVQDLTDVTTTNGAVAGTTYNITSSVLPKDQYVYVYKQDGTCTTANSVTTCTKSGYVEQHEGSATGTLIATIPDVCTTIGVDKDGAATETALSVRGVGQTCKAGHADSGYPTGMTDGGTYKVGGVVIPRDTVTKVYTVHTTAEPGYITTSQGETVLSVVSDTCTPAVGTKGSNSKTGIILNCKVQDLTDVTTIPSGVTAGTTYTIESSDLPAGTEYVYVYRTNGTCTGTSSYTCPKPGYVEQHVKNSTNTYASYNTSNALAKIPDNCSSVQLDKNGSVIASGSSATVRGIGQTCVAGKADHYPSNTNWAANKEYSISNNIIVGHDSYFYQYHYTSCTGSGASRTCAKPGYTTQHVGDDNTGTIVATIPDSCVTAGLDKDGAQTSTSTAIRGVGQTCTVGHAASSTYPSNFEEGNTYKVGGIVIPRDTVTKVYTVHTTTEPGYITTTQGNTVLSVVSDTCTPTVGKNASNKDALVLSCKVQDLTDVTTIPSGVTAGTTYTIISSALPKDQYVYVYKQDGTCATTNNVTTCTKLGRVEQHEGTANGTLIATIPDVCTTIGVDKDGAATETALDVRGIGQTCKAGHADSGYPTGITDGGAYKIGGIVIPQPDVSAAALKQTLLGSSSENFAKASEITSEALTTTLIGSGNSFARRSDIPDVSGFVDRSTAESIASNAIDTSDKILKAGANQTLNEAVAAAVATALSSAGTCSKAQGKDTCTTDLAVALRNAVISVGASEASPAERAD